MLGIMTDTQVAEEGISADAPAPYRLTDPAVRRLMRVLNVTEIEELRSRLGFSRMTFYRLRTGGHDIRLSEARRLAAIAGWPLHRMFVEVKRA